MNIDTNRLYNDLADLWPLVSASEDYAVEARSWHDMLALAGTRSSSWASAASSAAGSKERALRSP